MMSFLGNGDAFTSTDAIAIEHSTYTVISEASKAVVPRWRHISRLIGNVTFFEICRLSAKSRSMK